VESWQRCELTDVTAKVVIYEAFVGGKLEAPKHLARTVHDLYFEPRYWSARSRVGSADSKHFGSVAHKVVGRACCPVLTVGARPGGEHA